MHVFHSTVRNIYLRDNCARDEAVEVERGIDVERWCSDNVKTDDDVCDWDVADEYTI